MAAGWLVAKQETTVPDAILTVVGMKPLDISSRTLGHFPAVFMATEPTKLTK